MKLIHEFIVNNIPESYKENEDQYQYIVSKMTKRMLKYYKSEEEFFKRFDDLESFQTYVEFFAKQFAE